MLFHCNKNLTKSLGILGAILSMSAMQCAQAAQQEITVAKSGGDYLTVTDALNAIQPSATNPYVINVAPGSYNECEVPMKSYVHLRGAGSNLSAIRCNIGYMDGTIMVVQQNDVEISGLRLQGRIAGINAQSSSNLTIRNNYFETTSGTGFVGARILDVNSGSISNNQFIDNYVGIVSMASSITISDNHIIGKSKSWSVGISISNHAAYLNASPTVTGNVIEDGATGLSFYGSGSPNSAPVISGNTIRNNSSYGVDVRYTNNVPTIRDNTITNNAVYGIYIHFSNAVFLNNRVTDNGTADIALSGSGVPHISYTMFDTLDVINASSGAKQGSYNIFSDGTPNP